MSDKPTFSPHGRHLIAGEWVAGETSFSSEPATGPAYDFAIGTPDLVDRAAKQAETAFWTYGYATRDQRAAFLDAIADEIEARAEDITAIGSTETGLPEARLQGEQGRTSGQLRLFARHIREGGYLDRRHDEAIPERSLPAVQWWSRVIPPIPAPARWWPRRFSPPSAPATCLLACSA